jgi:hypothetical protein
MYFQSIFFIFEKDYNKSKTNSGVEEATRREPSAWGYNWATLFRGDINTGDLALQVGGVSNLKQ